MGHEAAMRVFEVPGSDSLRLQDLVLDLNGTLSDRGELISGAAERVARLSADLHIHLLTADTLGTAAAVGRELGLSVTRIETGDDKVAFVARLGAESTAAIGNGRNDVAMLRAARLGIAIIGPEGAASSALLAATVVCRSVIDALDLLLDDRLLVATLRP
jgi:P-type E1-E2 ATPase